MKGNMRRLLLNLATGAAIAATAAVVFVPSAALAAPATATTAVNVRDTPNGAIVDRLRSGEQVDVRECRSNNWCFVTRSNRSSGWVSAQYLTGITVNPSVNLGFTIPGGPSIGIGIGPGGPSIGIGVGPGPRPPGPGPGPFPPGPGPRPPVPPVFEEPVGEVCFYDRSRLRGDSFCVEEGETVRDLGRWADRISSIENPDGFEVTVCTETRLRGDCRTYTSGANTLGAFDDTIRSIEVY